MFLKHQLAWFALPIAARLRKSPILATQVEASKHCLLRQSDLIAQDPCDLFQECTRWRHAKHDVARVH